jgi:hypothetical protein
MAPILTPEQQGALDAQPNVPLRVIDPRNQAVYVLLSAEQYGKVKALFENGDYDLRETYPAQMESAMRAGWGDPAMDAYNDYDANRGQP